MAAPVMQESTVTVALAGNPNAGKTSIFNNDQAEEPRPAPLKIDYGREIEEEAAKLEKAIRENPALAGKYPEAAYELRDNLPYPVALGVFGKSRAGYSGRGGTT